MLDETKLNGICFRGLHPLNPHKGFVEQDQ